MIKSVEVTHAELSRLYLADEIFKLRSKLSQAKEQTIEELERVRRIIHNQRLTNQRGSTALLDTIDHLVFMRIEELRLAPAPANQGGNQPEKE